jgi:hypothetical protein
MHLAGRKFSQIKDLGITLEVDSGVKKRLK